LVRVGEDEDQYTGSLVDEDRVREIEDKIAELERRWPAHSAPPDMWQELERLENEFKEAQETEVEDT
jgi:hypothetical protein